MMPLRGEDSESAEWLEALDCAGHPHGLALSLEVISLTFLLTNAKNIAAANLSSFVRLIPAGFSTT